MKGKLIGYFKVVQRQFHGLKSIHFHYHQSDKYKAILHCFYMLLLYRKGKALHYVKVDEFFQHCYFVKTYNLR